MTTPSKFIPAATDFVGSATAARKPLRPAAKHLQNALLDGTVELPYDWNFHAERNPEDDCLHGATLRFYAGQECVPIRLSRSRRALLVKLTEQSIKGQWTTTPNTAGGGGIVRHWFSWLHAD